MVDDNSSKYFLQTQYLILCQNPAFKLNVKKWRQSHKVKALQKSAAPFDNQNLLLAFKSAWMQVRDSGYEVGSSSHMF